MEPRGRDGRSSSSSRRRPIGDRTFELDGCSYPIRLEGALRWVIAICNWIVKGCFLRAS